MAEPEPTTTPLHRTLFGEPPRPVLFRSGNRTLPSPILLEPPEVEAFFQALPGHDQSTSTTRVLQRRRRAVLIAFVVAAASVLVVGQVVRRTDPPSAITIAPAATALPPVNLPTHEPDGVRPSHTTPDASDQPPADSTDIPHARTVRTAGVFAFDGGYGPVLGTAGPIRHFTVAVERTVEKTLADHRAFAHKVDSTLGDWRSWVAGGKFRLQRVPTSAKSEFSIYLASPVTSKRMCAAGGLSTGGFSSCRLPGQVIINSDRWRKAVPDYDASLATYRSYAINHEVGHQLGQSHRSCPGKGRRAPVMQPQTYGLQGCVANAWPFVDGKRYTGASIS